LQLIDEDTYEEIILCWAKEYLKNKYETVIQLGGAGDKGRDVCGYTDFKNDKFDLYQCKHYSKQLTYSSIRLEFAKLVYYTFINNTVFLKILFCCSTRHKFDIIGFNKR
jgi:hypothetical protein